LKALTIKNVESVNFSKAITIPKVNYLTVGKERSTLKMKGKLKICPVGK
jgi:hypothetical protein